MLFRKALITVATASPSAALHGRGRGRPSPPKTTTLISSLLPMVLRIVLLVLPSYVVLPSTLPTLATTILRARCSLRPRVVTTGLVQCTFRQMPTTCTSIAAVSIRRAPAFVATVSPYAAPRSRVDSAQFFQMGYYFVSDSFSFSRIMIGNKQSTLRILL